MFKDAGSFYWWTSGYKYTSIASEKVPFIVWSLQTTVPLTAMTVEVANLIGPGSRIAKQKKQEAINNKINEHNSYPKTSNPSCWVSWCTSVI